jgi:hypothetical protein
MIFGEGLRLKAPEGSDIPRFVSWLNDPEVRFESARLNRRLL